MGYTREQRAANAAKAANEAAQTLQTEERRQPTPDTVTADGEVRAVQTKNPKWAVADELDALSDSRGGMVTETTEESETQEPKADTPVVEQEAKAPAAQEAGPVVSAPEAPKMVKIKVDGEEFDVSQEEVDAAGGVHALQRDRASDNRLKKANEALAESRRIAAQTQQQHAALAQYLQQQNQPPAPNRTQIIQQAVNAIRAGTDEKEVMQAVEQMLQAASPAQVNPQEIENKAIFKMNQAQAAAAFKKEFSDIASVPLLMEMAGNLENKLLTAALQNAGIQNLADPRLPLFDFGTFYRSIGNQIRGAVPRPSQPQQPADTTTGTPSQPSEKEARKASIVTLPTAATLRATPPAEEKPLTHREVLAEEAKARGKVGPYG